MLSIVLRDSLHQPQYVEKLEKILRFMIKEKALSLQNLDKLWEAQVYILFYLAHLAQIDYAVCIICHHMAHFNLNPYLYTSN